MGMWIILREGNIVDRDHSIVPAASGLSTGGSIAPRSCSLATDWRAQEVVGIHAQAERFFC